MSQLGKYTHSSKDKENGLMVSYTHINGLVSAFIKNKRLPENQETRHLVLVEMKLCDSENMPVGERQYNVWAKQKSEKGRRSNGDNKEGRDNGKGGKRRKYDRGVEDRVGNEKWKKKRLGSCLRSTQDQCLGREQYGDMLKDAYKCLKNIIGNSDNITMMGQYKHSSFPVYYN